MCWIANYYCHIPMGGNCFFGMDVPAIGAIYMDFQILFALKLNQPGLTCPNLTVPTLEKGGKSVQR